MNFSYQLHFIYTLIYHLVKTLYYVKYSQVSYVLDMEDIDMDSSTQLVQGHNGRSHTFPTHVIMYALLSVKRNLPSLTRDQRGKMPRNHSFSSPLKPKLRSGTVPCSLGDDRLPDAQDRRKQPVSPHLFPSWPTLPDDLCASGFLTFGINLITVLGCISAFTQKILLNKRQEPMI